MPIHFKTVTKTNKLTTNTPVKNYAQAINSGETDFKELLQETAKASKLNIIDATRFYYHLEAIMEKELENGKVVRLGGIGSFQIGIGSNGFETAKEVTSQKIIKSKINFRPGKAFKDMLKELKFKKIK